MARVVAVGPFTVTVNVGLNTVGHQALTTIPVVNPRQAVGSHSVLNARTNDVDVSHSRECSPAPGTGPSNAHRRRTDVTVNNDNVQSHPEDSPPCNNVGREYSIAVRGEVRSTKYCQ